MNFQFEFLPYQFKILKEILLIQKIFFFINHNEKFGKYLYIKSINTRIGIKIKLVLSVDFLLLKNKELKFAELNIIFKYNRSCRLDKIYTKFLNTELQFKSVKHTGLI